MERKPYASEILEVFLIVSVLFSVFLDKYISYEWRKAKERTPSKNHYLLL